MKHYIQLDVSIKRTFIYVINEYGKIIREDSEKRDPRLIADYLEKLDLEEMTVGFQSSSLKPTHRFQTRRILNRAILLTARRGLVKQQTHLTNSVRGLFKSCAIGLGSVSPNKFLAAVVKQVENCQEIVILSIKCLLDAFDKLVEERAKIDQKMLEIAYHDN